MAAEGTQEVDLEKHPSGIVPVLQNIVSTVNMDCKLDLKEIALRARNAEYNPKVRPWSLLPLLLASSAALIWRQEDPEESRSHLSPPLCLALRAAFCCCHHPHS